MGIDQRGQSGNREKASSAFWPFIAGTFWVTIVGVVLAVPPCILTALYLSEYARASTRAIMKPLLDLLAAIPSVVYGVWGVVAIVPLVGDKLAPAFEKYLGFIPFFTSKNPTGYSILAGGIVLAVMIAPFIIAVTYEVLATVSQGLREASLAVGATRWQTIRSIVLSPDPAGHHRGGRARSDARPGGNDGCPDGGRERAAGAEVHLRYGLSAPGADRKQLRRDDVHPAL